MSASDDIKRTLVAHFQAQGVDTRPADWKRRAKTMVGDYVVRTFDNASANLAAHAVTVDEEDCDFDEACIWETGPIGFGIGHEEGRTFISFVPMAQWHRTGGVASIDDYAHYERGIPGIPVELCGDDCGDNRYALQADMVEGVARDLTKRGFERIALP